MIPLPLKKEKAAYLPLPVVRNVDQTIIQTNYLQLKKDVQNIVESVMEGILNDTAKGHLHIKK
jgi:hypothetical protein